MLISCVCVWQSAYFKSSNGTLVSKAWLGLNEELAAVFSFPGVNPYWSTIRALRPGEFVEFAGRMIQEKAVPGGDNAWKARRK